jgi:hypothetical protein
MIHRWLTKRQLPESALIRYWNCALKDDEQLFRHPHVSLRHALGAFALNVAPELLLQRPSIAEKPISLGLDLSQDQVVPASLCIGQFNFSLGHTSFPCKLISLSP